ncbi:hypothetical protein BH23BAC1_BH23BAC1_22690 [soil metagenome]
MRRKKKYLINNITIISGNSFSLGELDPKNKFSIIILLVILIKMIVISTLIWCFYFAFEFIWELPKAQEIFLNIFIK